MAITATTRENLKIHIQQKNDNSEWISTCRGRNPEVPLLEGWISAFPYAPKEDALGSVESTTFGPQENMTFLPQVEPGNRPLFLINTPLGHLPGEPGYARVSKLTSLLQTETFGQTAQDSQQGLMHQFSLVIGVNQIRSIDPSMNTAFIEYIARFPRVENIALRVFGFFWNPVWEKKKGKKMHEGQIYPCEKSFLILKALACPNLQAVREAHESAASLATSIREQIPFQQIREKIKDSQETASLVQYFHTATATAPIYFGIMDADCEHLRTNAQAGLFTRMEQHIQGRHHPSVLSLGYSVKADERPLIQLGVRLDMLVRQAMNSVFPYGVYFPEPGSLFLIRKIGAQHPFLKRISFLGNGSGLESRRLIQSGLKNGVFDQNAVFIADGGIVTGTPGRMKTLKNGEVETLTPKLLRQKQYLKALRDISQTHATPKQWADNLYVGLNFSTHRKGTRVTDVTGPMMHIFNVFDPISRMYKKGRFSTKTFDTVLDEYHKPMAADEISLLQTETGKLAQLGMPQPLIDHIIEAAKRSGDAIFQELSRVS